MKMAAYTVDYTQPSEGNMDDFQSVFDALEQFKREHPEYVKALEVIEQTRQIIDAYAAATRPQYRIVTTDHTNGAIAVNDQWIGNVSED